jgi:5-methylcytosine-specific restriction endonuclease McrA
MTPNTDTHAMSSEPESGPEQTLTGSEDDPHIILERSGFQCQICGKIGHPDELAEELVLVHPVHHDVPPDVGIAVCEDCWVARTDERLDEYVAEVQERQRALEEDPGDYAQNRERAFERDAHTCQLCGQEGYPKTERGLVAYPVRAGDFHLDNLVTVCNDCITDTLDSDEEEQKAADRLRIRAAKAKEWVNADGPDAEQAESIDGYW